MEDEKVDHADEPRPDDDGAPPDDEPGQPTSDDEDNEHGLENEPMMPPGEDAQHENSEGIPLKSIADDVDGSEETGDMTDVESGDA